MRAGLPIDDWSHFGLAYELMAPPVGADGKPDLTKREAWLNRCVGLVISPDYAAAYHRWKDSLEKTGAIYCEMQLDGRLLVGHGNVSAAEVGLSVHRTWGVPIIPGSALKGLAAGYVTTVHGPDDGEQDDERAKWTGVRWDGYRIVGAPGEHFRTLFGSPPVDGIDDVETQGAAIFHDALYVPASVPGDKPFVPDVLTVHQKEYYRAHGANDRWPNDWDSPNPVPFLTVWAGARFLFAVEGPEDWAKLAMDLLRAALSEWGVGAKTSLGYGRLKAASAASAARPDPRHAAATGPRRDQQSIQIRGAGLRAGDYVSEAGSGESGTVLDLRDNPEPEALVDFGNGVTEWIATSRLDRIGR